jgi:Glycosyltransferase 61
LARHKSPLKKRLNGRWLRWAFWRGVFRVVPLARRYSFPMTSATATATAITVIERDTVLEAGGFSPAQMDRVVSPGLANDKIRVARAPVGATYFAREIAIVPDCAALGHVGVMTRTSDGAVLFRQAGRPPNWNMAKPKRLKARHLGADLVASLLGAGHYYHFFEKLLPLLGYLDRHHPQGTPLSVLVSAEAPAFQRHICQAVEAAYPGVRCIGLAPDERGLIDRYLWLHEAADNAEWLPVTAEAAARLAATLRAFYRQPKPTGRELMFVSRGNAPLRKLLNEPELEALGARRGFRRFEASATNHAEQVQRFGNAAVIVAVHGAGLTNLLFARPGTIVIEIFPEDFIKTTFLWLSNRLGMRHYPLVGSRGNYDQAFSVDPTQFAAILDSVLSPSRELSPQPHRIQVAS